MEVIMELLSKIDDEYDLISERLLNSYFIEFIRILREKGVDVM